VKGRSIVLVLALGGLGIAAWMFAMANSLRTNELAEIMKRNGIESQEILIRIMAGEDEWSELTAHNKGIIRELDAAAQSLHPSLQLEAAAVTDYLEDVNDAIEAYAEAELQYNAANNDLRLDSKENVAILGLSTKAYADASETLKDRLGNWKANMLDFLNAAKWDKVAAKAYTHSLSGGALAAFSSRQTKIQAILTNKRDYLRLIHDNWSNVRVVGNRLVADNQELQAEINALSRAIADAVEALATSKITVQHSKKLLPSEDDQEKGEVEATAGVRL